MLIPMHKIHPNSVALRSVDYTSQAYKELMISIREKGVLNAISVRRKPRNGVNYYEIVDGLHRYQAAKYCGITWIKADVTEVDDAQVLEAQILANSMRASTPKVPTKPYEYSTQLKRMLSLNPTLTLNVLAVRLGKKPSWIQQRLSLCRIKDGRIRDLIDDGKIVLANAYALAKLPVDEQFDWINRAITYSPDELMPMVEKHLKAITSWKRQQQYKRQQQSAKMARPARLYGGPVPSDTIKQLYNRMPLTFPDRPLGIDVGKQEQLDVSKIVKSCLKEIDERQLSSHELLHGKKVIDYKVVRAKGDPIGELRKGWDRVKKGFCRGDWLVHHTGRCWAIYNPKVLKLGNLDFNTSLEGQLFIERHFCD